MVVDEDWSAPAFDEYDVQLLVVLSNDVWDSDCCLRIARERRIPSLLIMDGLLEFRHQWTCARFAAGGGAPFLTPVNADKIACAGWADARRLASWGNQGKCEVVGLPRLDRWLPVTAHSVPVRKPARVLVCSSNTPGYDGTQRSRAVTAFQSLLEHASKRPDVTLVWRLTRHLDTGVRLPADAEQSRGQSLEDALSAVDAVITQPSTVQVEAMIRGLPTAVLDFDNVPQFTPAAWRVTATCQIEDVVNGLLAPQPSRMAYQDECLHNALSCRTPATPRMVCLAEAMIGIGKAARTGDRPLSFPLHILPLEDDFVVSQHYDLRMQYPGHPTFHNRDLLDMQRRLAMLERALEEARGTLFSRRFAYWLDRGVGHVYQWLRRGKA